MSTLSTDKNMNKIYYSSQSSVGKQTYAYLSASFKDLLAIDINKTNVTGTLWKTLAEKLNLGIGDLVDTNTYDVSNYKDASSEFSETDWIKILNNNPEVLTYPIVILGDSYYQIKNPSDIENLLEPNSKGIDEKKYI